MILRIAWQSCLLLALGVAGALGTYHWMEDRPELYLVSEPAGPDEITVRDAIALDQQKKVLWLDARRRSEFDKAHIPGAMLLNLYEWEDLVTPVVMSLSENMDRTIIIYCDAKKCEASRELREKLLTSGLGDLDIRVLHGGWPAWQGR
jgi:rhodanese-related sulfurtransferase